jgi:hypothetical protein
MAASDIATLERQGRAPSTDDGLLKVQAPAKI